MNNVEDVRVTFYSNMRSIIGQIPRLRFLNPKTPEPPVTKDSR